MDEKTGSVELVMSDGSKYGKISTYIIDDGFMQPDIIINNIIKSAQPNVRNEISRKSADAVLKLVQLANTHDYDTAYRAFNILFESVMPFLTPDVNKELSKLAKDWADEKAHRDAESVLQGREAAEPILDGDAW